MNPQVILVTGSNGLLGQAIARSFLEDPAGPSVWLGIRDRHEAADALAAAFAPRCRTVPLEVTQPAAWETAVGQITRDSGRLDVLVNNAGTHRDGLLAQMPLAAWREVLGTNLDGTFLGCQAVLPVMINHRFGRIINVASLSALLPPAGQANYGAAKAGVVALTQALAKEVARIGITVNAVCPGFVDTEMLAGLEPAARQAMLARIPMRRFGRPEEVAAAVRFLACPAAGYITGSVLKIDGGIL